MTPTQLNTAITTLLQQAERTLQIARDCDTTFAINSWTVNMTAYLCPRVNERCFCAMAQSSRTAQFRGCSLKRWRLMCLPCCLPAPMR